MMTTYLMTISRTITETVQVLVTADEVRTAAVDALAASHDPLTPWVVDPKSVRNQRIATSELILMGEPT